LKEDICVCLERECAQARVTKGTLGKVRSLLSQMIFSWLEHKKLQRSILFDEEEFQHGFENCVYSLESMKWFLDWIFGKMAGYQSMDTRKENVVDKIKEYIDSHLQEELSRERLAGMVYLSAGHISRVFRDEVGMPLSNYVIMRRMEKAKEYLRTTNLGVSEIAMKVGYTNFSYFSMTFKDYTGCTPNEFRKQLLKK
jgi:two-component system response regulator YesN